MDVDTGRAMDRAMSEPTHTYLERAIDGDGVSGNNYTRDEPWTERDGGDLWRNCTG